MINYESVVCTCRGAYMRVGIRNDNRHFFFFSKCCLGLPVVHEVSGIVTMKSIDMYILHESSLVVCFSNISAYFA